MSLERCTLVLFLELWLWNVHLENFFLRRTGFRKGSRSVLNWFWISKLLHAPTQDWPTTCTTCKCKFTHRPPHAMAAQETAHGSSALNLLEESSTVTNAGDDISERSDQSKGLEQTHEIVHPCHRDHLPIRHHIEHALIQSFLGNRGNKSMTRQGSIQTRDCHRICTSLSSSNDC